MISTETGSVSTRRAARASKLIPAFLWVIATAAIGGCASDVVQRGNLPSTDKVTEIQPGSTTREDVAKLLGTPSSTSVFDDRTWYYISRRTKQLSFLSPQVLDQQVYVIDFDDKGVVKKVDHKNLKDARNVTPAPGATPAPGRELSFLEQVLGNLGKFNGGGGGGGGGSEGRSGNTSHGPSPNGGNP